MQTEGLVLKTLSLFGLLAYVIRVSLRRCYLPPGLGIATWEEKPEDIKDLTLQLVPTTTENV